MCVNPLHAASTAMGAFARQCQDHRDCCLPGDTVGNLYIDDGRIISLEIENEGTLETSDTSFDEDSICQVLLEGEIFGSENHAVMAGALSLTEMRRITLDLDEDETLAVNSLLYQPATGAKGFVVNNGTAKHTNTPAINQCCDYEIHVVTKTRRFVAQKWQIIVNTSKAINKLVNVTSVELFGNTAKANRLQFYAEDVFQLFRNNNKFKGECQWLLG